MDSAVIRNAVGGLEILLRTAEQALWRVDRDVLATPDTAMITTAPSTTQIGDGGLPGAGARWIASGA